MFKRIFTIMLNLIILGSLLYSLFLANSIYEEYKETIQWENSSLLSKIHQVPPALAQNYISIDEQKIFQVLTDVNIALDEIKKENEIKDNKLDKYWDLHEQAEGLIDKVESKKAKEIFNDFDLYLNADLAIKSAYDKLDTAVLNEYAKIFSNRLSKEDDKLEERFLEDLHTISNDYKKLNEFSMSAINRLGVIENNILEVDIKVNKTITTELLDEINANELTRFAHIRSLVETLNGNSWDKILAHNSSSLEYYSWKESQEILEGLLASNYVAISSFETVEDVLAYSPSYPLETKENFTVNEDSSVISVHYQGDQLDEDLYIKRGSTLTFIVDYEYTENPQSTVTVEYIDENGNKLNDDEVYEGYVGNALTLDIKDIDGYVIVEVIGSLSEFPDEDSTIQVIYEEYVPEEIPDDGDEDSDEEDEDEDDDEDDSEEEEVEDEDDSDGNETDSNNNS